MPIKEMKKETRKAKEGGLAKAERKVKTAVSLLNPKTISKFCFLRMPELCNLIFSFGSESREVLDL